MSKPCEESERLVQYLVDHHPECLEVRSSGGHTPLAVAFSLHRISFARILIASGANQATCDSQGKNLLHLLLFSIEGEPCNKPDDIAPLTKLLDQSLIPTMLVQRAGEGSWTPFAQWLGSCRNSGYVSSEDIMISITASIFDLAVPTNQKHLELLDGLGNTPVHIAVQMGFAQIVELMLDRRPDLLYRENAMGIMPLEIAVDAWVKDITHTVPRHPLWMHDVNQKWKWYRAVERDPKYFVEGADHRKKQEIMLDICQRRARQNPRKRGLVSLCEAKEVPKRSAVRRQQSNIDNGYARLSAPLLDTAAPAGADEVSLWGHLAWTW